MLKEQLFITIPKRGIKIIPPPETAHKISQARRGIVVEPFSLEERARLRELINAKILAKRYPTPEVGKAFMADVDHAWRQQLMKFSNALALMAINSWTEISPKPIAVVLFGSLSRGLVKRPDHPDPSNIDIACIGEFTNSEKAQLLDKIRPARQAIAGYIKSKSPNMSPDSKGGNVGVNLHTIESMQASNYSSAINYLQAAAAPLYDPHGIWGKIEAEAIQRAMPKRWRICSIPFASSKNGKVRIES